MRPLLASLALLLLLAACATSRRRAPSIGGSWELSVLPGAGKPFEELFDHRRPELRLDASKGTVTGNTGCNSFSGTFTVINERLSFSPNLVTTRMACPGYDETIFTNALNQVNRYTVNATVLSLLHDSTLVMTFTRRP